VVCAREHGQLGVWEQAEHLHGVLGADDIGIPDHDHGCRVDGLNILRPPGSAAGVVRHLLEGQRAIDVGGVPVPLLFDGDYLQSLRMGWQNLFE
jgi:hypothetical protein